MILMLCLFIIIVVILVVFISFNKNGKNIKKVRVIDEVKFYRHPSIKNSKIYHSHYHRRDHPHRFEHEKFNLKPHKHLHSHGPPVVSLYE